MSKVMGIFVKFWPFLRCSPIMVMPREANFENFYFVLILHSILGKVTKFLVEKLHTSETISQKPHGGGVEYTPLAPVPSELKSTLRLLCQKAKVFFLIFRTDKSSRPALFCSVYCSLTL